MCPSIPRGAKRKPSMTQDELKSILHYDLDTGLFTWLISPAKQTLIGTVAGHRNEKGYIKIGYKRKIYAAHRLAWLYVTGEWPVDQIDHWDLIKDNNRWLNLRECSNRENQFNQNVRIDNLLGVRNISKRKGKFMVRFQYNGKHRSFGTFSSLEEAKTRADHLRKELHGEFAKA